MMPGLMSRIFGDIAASACRTLRCRATGSGLMSCHIPKHRGGGRGWVMSLTVDTRTFANLVADPEAAETLSAALGCPLVVVEVPDAASARWLAGLRSGALPAVVVLVVPDPGCLTASAALAGDIVLTEDGSAPAPF